MRAKLGKGPASLRKPPTAMKLAALRAKLLADPHTPLIAFNVGLLVEDYANKVMHFVANPTEGPELYLVDDDDLRAQGFVPPDTAAVIRYLKQAQEMIEAGSVSKLRARKKKKKKVEINSKAKALEEMFANPGLKELLDNSPKDPLPGKRGRKR